MITHFKGNRSPSMTDTIRVNGAPFNLTGKTVKFKMRSESSSTLKVDANATISNPPGTDGQVHYDWAALDVDTVGRFLFWWSVDLGGSVIQDTPEFLITFVDHAPVSRALCTLEDVQSYVPGYIAYSDLETDTILMELITAASTEIHNVTSREFLPVATNPSAKVFELSDFDAAERRVFIGDLSNTTGMTVAITQADGTAVANISMPNSAIVGEPRNRQQWEPFNYLRFPPGLASSPSLAGGYLMTVTGNWGFPQIPSDIRTACVKLVINRYVRDVAAGGTAFADALTDADFALSTAFASAQDTIDYYSFHSIA